MESKINKDFKTQFLHSIVSKPVITDPGPVRIKKHLDEKNETQDNIGFPLSPSEAGTVEDKGRKTKV